MKHGEFARLQLELASYGGFTVVLAVIAIVIWNAASAGFPAIQSGELKIWSMNVSVDPVSYAKCCEAIYHVCMSVLATHIRILSCSGRLICRRHLLCSALHSTFNPWSVLC